MNVSSVYVASHACSSSNVAGFPALIGAVLGFEGDVAGFSALSLSILLPSLNIRSSRYSATSSTFFFRPSFLPGTPNLVATFSIASRASFDGRFVRRHSSKILRFSKNCATGGSEDLHSNLERNSDKVRLSAAALEELMLSSSGFPALVGAVLEFEGAATGFSALSVSIVLPWLNIRASRSSATSSAFLIQPSFLRGTPNFVATFSIALRTSFEGRFVRRHSSNILRFTKNSATSGSEDLHSSLARSSDKASVLPAGAGLAALLVLPAADAPSFMVPSLPLLVSATGAGLAALHSSLMVPGLALLVAAAGAGLNDDGDDDDDDDDADDDDDDDDDNDDDGDDDDDCDDARWWTATTGPGGSNDDNDDNDDNQGTRGSREARNKGTQGTTRKQGTREPRNQGTQGIQGTAGKQGTKEPGNQGTREPRNQGTRDKGTREPQETKEPRNHKARGSQGIREPKKQGTREPKNQGTKEPGNQGTKKPRNPGNHKEPKNQGNQGTKEPGNPRNHKEARNQGRATRATPGNRGTRAEQPEQPRGPGGTGGGPGRSLTREN